VQSFVRHCLAVGEVGWFPIGVASELLVLGAVESKKTLTAQHSITSSNSVDVVESGERPSGDSLTQSHLLKRVNTIQGHVVALTDINTAITALQKAKAEEKPPVTPGVADPPSTGHVFAASKASAALYASMMSSMKTVNVSADTLMQRLSGLDAVIQTPMSDAAMPPSKVQVDKALLLVESVIEDDGDEDGSDSSTLAEIKPALKPCPVSTKLDEDIVSEPPLSQDPNQPIPQTT